MAFGQISEGDEGAAKREELWVEGTSAELSLPNVSSISFTLMNLFHEVHHWLFNCQWHFKGPFSVYSP